MVLSIELVTLRSRFGPGQCRTCVRAGLRACTASAPGVVSPRYPAVRSLRDLQAAHPSLLLIDAASAWVHVCWINQAGEIRWGQREGEAGQVLFPLIAESGADLAAVDAFVHCEGPGSILGIRTAAAAIRTWIALRERPVWSYRSLELPARCHGQIGDAFICDARRQSWHRLAVVGTEGQLGPIERVPATELNAGSCHLPAGFRTWTPLPDPAPRTVPYEPAQLTGNLIDVPLLRECPEPDAFQHEAPSYQLWEPKVHQAPASS